MYRCGNPVEIGDCVTIEVTIDVEEMQATPGDVAMVLDANYSWAGSRNIPLLTIKRHDDKIEQIPANWCTLCQRK